MAETLAKLKWNEHPIRDDIRYHGPLTYRHFKIIGWLLFVVKMIIPPLKLAAKAAPAAAEALAVPLSIMELVAPLSVFFLLIASMSQLLVKQDYKKQMLVNGGAALAIVLVFELLYHRYIVGSVDAFVEDRAQTLALCNALFSSINPMGFVTFNVFLDLFLCTCVMFFLNYEPTKVFVGDRRKWFRCFAILPVLYELACLWLKLQANSGEFHTPISFFPFLTTKPPMMFFVFCAMVVYQTTLEKRFCKAGRTHEEFEAYLETNRSSWQFAKFSAIACLVAGLADLIIIAVAVAGELNASMTVFSSLSDEAQELWFYNMVNKYANAGFGGSVDLLFFVPIMLLFDYKKTYKNTLVEMAIPAGAIILLVVIFLEGGLFGMHALASVAKKQILPQIGEMLAATENAEGAGGAEGSAEDEAEIDALLAMLLMAGDDEGASASEAPQPTTEQQPATGQSATEQQPATGQAPAAEQPATELAQQPAAA